MATDSTSLTGLDLRKALCEKLGWRRGDNFSWGKLRGNKELWMPPSIEPCNPIDLQALPALESDPGVFWPEFEKWSESTNHDYEFCRCHSQNFYRFHIYQCGVRDDPADIWIDGANLTDAGCRAWLAALEAIDAKR